MITLLKDLYLGKVPPNKRRSGQWPTLRKHFLEKNPKCAVCGGTKNLEAHHIRPFHLHPELELDENNLIALCESNANGINCHLAFGHLGSFKSVNANVVDDAAEWNKKITNRP